MRKISIPNNNFMYDNLNSKRVSMSKKTDTSKKPNFKHKLFLP